MPHGIGHIARPSEFKTPQQTAEFNNAAQRWLREHTRLGIPALMHEEALHGYVAFDATSFPQAMALASSWSADDVQEMYSVAAREMRATGAHWALAPVLDIARDPRWGRIEETMGEDPYLVSTLRCSPLFAVCRANLRQNMAGTSALPMTKWSRH